MSAMKWVVPAVAGVLSACGAPGHWMGAGAEKMYDQNLEAIRATAVLNNDDYYELHRDGRIYVIADAGDLREFLGNGELPLRVTRIGGGPKGETIVFGIARPESKKKDGFGSVEMYDGKREGSKKGFYAEVCRDNQCYVFGNWADLDAFRKSGDASGLSKADLTGPGGEVVMVAQPADALIERFRTVHAK
ncbi:MAG: hypothetical protein ACT4PK_00545 [Gammaproteobacteria bacterium]